MSDLADKIFELHIEVLRRILTGENFNEVEKSLSTEMDEVNYLKIAQNGLLSFNSDEELIAAYPVSPTKTTYKVEIEDIGTGYSMCAIDSLGIAYTFMKKTKVISEDHKTGENIELTIDPSTEIQDKELFVTYIRSEDSSCDPAEDQCPSLNFYLTEDNIENKEKYTILNYRDAVKHAKSVFGKDGMMKCIEGAIKNSDNFALSDLLIDVFER